MRADGTIDAETAKTKAATTNADQTKANEVINKCKDLGESILSSLLLSHRECNNFARAPGRIK